MSKGKSSAPPLRAFESTIMEELRVLHQEGIVERLKSASHPAILGRRVRALPWVPAAVLTTEVALATGGRKVRLVGEDLFGWAAEKFGLTKEQVEDFQSGKMRPVVLCFMNLELLEAELGELVDGGPLEASDPDDVEALLKAHPERLPSYSRPGDARIRSFKTQELGEWWLLLQGLVDGKLVWGRRYRRFPCTCYRLASKREQTRAQASAQANGPTDEGGLSEHRFVCPRDLMVEFGIPPESKQAFEGRLKRWRMNPRHRKDARWMEDKYRKSGGAKYLYRPEVALEIAKHDPDLTA